MKKIKRANILSCILAGAFVFSTSFGIGQAVNSKNARVAFITKIEELTSEKSDMEKEYSEKIGVLTGCIEELNQELLDGEIDLQTANDQIAILREDIKEITDQIDGLEIKNKGLLSQLNDLETDFTDLTSSYNTLLKEYEELQGKFSELQEDNKELQEKYDDLVDEKLNGDTIEVVSTELTALLEDIKEATTFTTENRESNELLFDDFEERIEKLYKYDRVTEEEYKQNLDLLTTVRAVDLYNNIDNAVKLRVESADAIKLNGTIITDQSTYELLQATDNNTSVAKVIEGYSVAYADTGLIEAVQEDGSYMCQQGEVAITNKNGMYTSFMDEIKFHTENRNVKIDYSNNIYVIGFDTNNTGVASISVELDPNTNMVNSWIAEADQYGVKETQKVIFAEMTQEEYDELFREARTAIDLAKNKTTEDELTK